MRRRTWRSRRSPRDAERGGVAVLLGVSLIGMIALTALAFDMSILYNWRGADQNAADHSALAAAHAACRGEDPFAAAYASAADNGFDNDGTTNVVAVTDLGSRRYQVIVRSTVDSSFAGALGVDRLPASAKAVAQCTNGGGDYVVFAGSEVCEPKTIDWSGSTNVVTGAVHTNNDFYMGGQSNMINGDTTYVGDVFVNGGNALSPPPQQVGVQPWPITFPIADYQPGGAKANLAQSQARYYNAGSSKIDIGWLESQGLYNSSTGAIAPGLYYTSGDIDLSASNMNGTVTFVSSLGTVSVAGSSQDLEPWDPDSLLLFSNKDTPCFDFAVKINGSTSSWVGFVYAPYGMIEMAGSDNSTFRGSLVGDTVRLNGSDLTIQALGDCCGGDNVTLLE